MSPVTLWIHPAAQQMSEVRASIPNLCEVDVGLIVDIDFLNYIGTELLVSTVVLRYEYLHPTPHFIINIQPPVAKGLSNLDKLYLILI